MNGELLHWFLERLKELGARPSASSRERECLLLLKERLESLGLMVEWDSFPAPSTYTWAYLVLWVGFAQAGFLIPLVPLWSVFSSLFLLCVAYLELATIPVVSALFRFGKSANLVGKSGESPELVLMAHVDSARASFFFHPRFVTNPRHSLLLFVASAVLITALSFVGLLFPFRELFWVALFPSLYLLFLASGHLHREFWMGFSPGGNDNGSGVAVVLEVSRILREKRIPFWVVFTGAEESGTWGALHFIRRYGLLVQGKPILNVDNVGIGALTVATREGMWKTYRPKASLIESFQALGEPGLHFRPYLGLSTDATPLLARGFEAVTLIALGENGLPVNWHWYTDTVEAVNRENLRRAVQLVVRWVEVRHGLSA